MQPLLSIIVVTYNAAATLQGTLESVWAQDGDWWELLVIDGASTDGTAEIVKRQAGCLAYWQSQPDRGIYDAMNQGVDRARGQWLYFLGADDQLEPGVLAQVQPFLREPAVLCYGDVRFSNGAVMQSAMNSRMVFQNMVHHQAAFYHRSLFADFRYDTSLRILSDYELNLRIYLQGLPTRRMDLTIAHCYAGGASSQLPLSLRETNQVRRRYLSGRWRNALYDWLLTAYYAQKRVRARLIPTSA